MFLDDWMTEISFYCWLFSVESYCCILILEHLSSSPVFSGVNVTRSLVLCVCFVAHCLSFCPNFSFDHCVVCPSSIYRFWLTLWYLQTLLWFFFFFYSLNEDRVSYHNLPTFKSCHVSECLPYHITCRYNLQKFTLSLLYKI